MSQSESQSDRKNVGNLKTDILNNWKWDPSESIQSLDDLHGTCIEFATDTIEWYNRKKGGKQAFAKWMRGCAIVITGIGALLLICSQQTTGISSSWATAALVVGATLVGLDRFFGLTNAWIRFIETANLIRMLLHAFKLDSEQQKTEWREGQPSDEQVAEALKLARSFISSVDAVVTAEINEWATQFRSSVTRHNARIDNALDQNEGK